MNSYLHGSGTPHEIMVSTHRSHLQRSRLFAKFLSRTMRLYRYIFRAVMSFYQLHLKRHFTVRVIKLLCFGSHSSTSQESATLLASHCKLRIEQSLSNFSPVLDSSFQSLFKQNFCSRSLQMDSEKFFESRLSLLFTIFLIDNLIKLAPHRQDLLVHIGLLVGIVLYSVLGSVMMTSAHRIYNLLRIY